MEPSYAIALLNCILKNLFGEKDQLFHNNPLKEAGVKNPEDWRCSSAFNYQDMESFFEVEKLPSRTAR
jgi:hypothetical protein